MNYFPQVDRIPYEGPKSRNPFAFRHYNSSESIGGKAMEDHLRFAVCYWHTMKGSGADPFGAPTILRDYNRFDDPMKVAEETMVAAFEFMSKLGVKFWCFHDRDIAPEADTLRETNARLDHIVDLAEKLMGETGIELLWGTTNAFSHPRFMAGASTNPSPHVFAYAAAQVKKAMEITHRLNGQGYVFWGGREGYDTLLNTDLKREGEQLARFLALAVDYKKSLGFSGQLYIEPKPCEPTTHQYDFDAQSCHAFLQKAGLMDHFKLNIEANHATLAGHSFQHELDYCVAHGILGSVDANRGDTLLGWDTDQFPTNIYDTTLAMYSILSGGGFTTGGLNFDAKLRRQSIDPMDLFHAHIGAMDSFAKGLKVAHRLYSDGVLQQMKQERYAQWESDFGKRIMEGTVSFDDLEAHVYSNGEPTVRSGRQEMLENILNDYLFTTD